MKILLILFSQSFLVPRRVPEGVNKAGYGEKRGSRLGKLKVEGISTYIEHIGKVSKAVYE